MLSIFSTEPTAPLKVSPFEEEENVTVMWVYDG